MAGSAVERKRKRKKVDEESSESEGGSDKEWNDHDDNAYIDFLKDFLFPGQSMEVNDDDEADPEYNILEDEEEHDSEEFRRDPAVKVSKKEFNELLAELYDGSLQVRNKGEIPQTIEPPTFTQPIQPIIPLETVPKPPLPPPLPPPSIVEEKEEEPLITEQVRGVIQYQLQQHVQLLTQTYVLTAGSTDEAVKPLARDSKKMIIELQSFALNLGPNSAFKVKNIPYAASLVNTFPGNFTSKSPIKKKILEERYRNEIIKIPGGSGHTFTREVVKTISESKAFMYPELLPVYPHLTSTLRINFTPNEDALIAIGCKEMQDKIYEPLHLKKKAKLIRDMLLPGRPIEQIYNRIKNARKHEKNEKVQNFGIQLLRRYLLDGVTPPSPLETWTPELLQIEPMEPINQQKLPSQWVSVLKQLKLDILFKDEFVELEPVKPRIRKSKIINSPVGEKQEKPVGKKSTKSKGVDAKLSDQSPAYINIQSSQVGPSSTSIEELERIPVLDKNGTPALYIAIPKKFCRNSGATPAPAPPEQDEDNNQCNTESVSDVSHEKSNCDLPSEKSPECTEKVLEVTPVGLPFSLPCLAENFSGSILEVQSLGSPLKREVFKKASEGETQSTKLVKKSVNIKSKAVASNTKIRKRIVKESIVKEVLHPACACEGPCGGPNCRGHHAARTWVYQRKSAEQRAAAVERKLHPKNSRKLRKDSEIQFPQPEDRSLDVISNSDGEHLDDSDKDSDSDSSVPSLFEEKIEPPSTDVETNSKSPKMIGDNSQNYSANDSGDQKASDGTNNSPNTETKNKSGTSGGRTPRNSKRDPPRQTAGDGDGEDDHNPDKNKKTGSSNKIEDSEHREEETEDDTEDKESPAHTSTGKLSAPKPGGSSAKDGKTKMDIPLGTPPPKTPRRMKRSPGSQTKKRTPKFKTTEIQKLLDEAESEVNIEAIETAFAEEFWTKCQHTVDPVLYNNLIQVFSDFGEKGASEEEVFAKVEDMLKDYPDLLIDLATMIEPQLLQKNNLLKDNYVVQAYIRFMHLLECPQLRARALQKIRGLRDLEKVTEKDVQELVDLFFQGNPVMTDAVKAMFPNIFPPESAVRSQDFEEINFDDDLPHSEEAMAMEVVNFPEESNVPATSSCPCDCHTDPKNVNFHTKARHCRKCCIKFQDGKVFMHSGRLMKQVNIEFATREKAEEILARRACGQCFEPLKGTASPKRKSSDRTSKRRLPKNTKISISDCDSESELKKSAASAVPSTSRSIPVDVQENEVHISAEAIPKTIKEPEEDLEEGEIIDEDEQPSEAAGAPSSFNPTLARPVTSEGSKSVQKTGIIPSEKKSKPDSQKPHRPWTYEEDKILLVTCQQESSTTVAFSKIMQKKLLPHRTLEDVKERFSYLASMIMKTTK